MILTLSARCLRSMLSPSGKGKKPQLDLLDLPKFTRESLGLAGVNLSTDLLAGADRSRLESIRERADRASCACLLLIEPDAQNFGSHDEALVAAAVHRTTRVAEAAHILGCSSIAVRIKASDDDATLLRVAAGLKKVVERAEKLDINLLLAPEAGLTSRPERVTELLKKIGGFRVGTFPDFQAAAASGDAPGYLHRLTPYATSVCASTIKLVGDAEAKPLGAGGGSAGSKAAKELRDSLAADIAAIAKAGSPAGSPAGLPAGLPAGSSSKSKPKPDDEDDDTLDGAGVGVEAVGKAAGKKGKAGKADAKADGKTAAADAKKGKGKKEAPAPVPPPVPAAADDELEDLDDAEMDELESLIDDVLDEVQAEPRVIAFEHEPYDLRPLLSAIIAVGYDGSLCLDYRGTGDIVLGLNQTRDTLVALIAEAKKAGV
jgi:hypothetical protein